MKLTDYIVKEIEKRDIDTIFGYTGGSIADFVDSVFKSKKLKFIQNYNEQASAFCANAYAHTTNKTGIAVASSGPGAINLINGIANAYFDSLPCIFITGNVHTLGRRTSDNIRQNAFQETDIVSMVKGITKYSKYIDNEKDIRYELEKAFYIANEGRKGPVLLDVPYDIQRKNIEPRNLSSFIKPEHQIIDIEINKFKELLIDSHRPLFLIGGGCKDTKSKIRELLKNITIPTVVSMRGLDIIPHDNKNFIGLIGSYGNRCANLAVKYCDLLIVLGSRLDERQMGYKKEEFAPNAKIIQVDIDKFELGRKTDNVLSIECTVDEFIDTLLKENIFFECKQWLKLLNEWKLKYTSSISLEKEFNANNFINYLSKILDDNAIITVDVGQNQIISSQSVHIKNNQNFLCSAGLACMGYSLPAAIGGYFANKKRQIISINGDGGIQMNLQELQTISREKIPVKIIVFNNNSLGLIRKLQENLFDRRYYASVIGYKNPNFEKLAYAFDFEYLKFTNSDNFKGLDIVLKSKNPALIEVMLSSETTCNPEPGCNIYTQQPELSMADIFEIEKQIEDLK